MELNADLVIYAGRLSNFLKSNREKGSITPDKPILASAIVEIAGREKKEDGSPKIKITVEDVYKIIHHAREKGDWIASRQKGYFWALYPEEFDSTIAEQTKKMKNCQETLTLLNRLRANCFKANNSVLESIHNAVENKSDIIIPLNPEKENNDGTTKQEKEND